MVPLAPRFALPPPARPGVGPEFSASPDSWYYSGLERAATQIKRRDRFSAISARSFAEVDLVTQDLGRNCLDCHHGHGGAQPYFLKPLETAPADTGETESTTSGIEPKEAGASDVE